MKPFVVDENQRCMKEFNNIQIGQTNPNNNNPEKNLIKCSWSPDQEFVATGGYDRFVLLLFIGGYLFCYYLLQVCFVCLFFLLFGFKMKFYLYLVY